MEKSSAILQQGVNQLNTEVVREQNSFLFDNSYILHDSYFGSDTDSIRRLLQKKDLIQKRTKSHSADRKMSINDIEKPESQLEEYNQLIENHQKKKKYKKQLKDFEIKTLLGKGGYGKVYLVQAKSSSQLYAMKVINKDRVKNPKQTMRTKTERYVLEKIHHPFLVHLKYAYQTREKLYMILDYCPGGELFYHLQRVGCFSERVAKFYASCILLGIMELHRNNIVYRE